MNGITCQVIGDLLPLYEDQMLSGDSRALVEEHLSRCPHCAGETSSITKGDPSRPGGTMGSPFVSSKESLTLAGY